MNTPANVELLRTAIAAQIALWNAQDALEEAFGIVDDDRKVDELAKQIQNLTAGAGARQITRHELQILLESLRLT